MKTIEITRNEYWNLHSEIGNKAIIVECPDETKLNKIVTICDNEITESVYFVEDNGSYFYLNYPYTLNIL